LAAGGAGVAVAAAPQATPDTRSRSNGMDIIALGFLIQWYNIVQPPQLVDTSGVSPPP